MDVKDDVKMMWKIKMAVIAIHRPSLTRDGSIHEQLDQTLTMLFVFLCTGLLSSLFSWMALMMVWPKYSWIIHIQYHPEAEHYFMSCLAFTFSILTCLLKDKNMAKILKNTNYPPPWILKKSMMASRIEFVFFHNERCAMLKPTRFSCIYFDQNIWFQLK